MANGYSAVHGNAFERVEQRLRADGYVTVFVCTYGAPGGAIPSDLDWIPHESGWVARRKIKAWCAKHGVTDFLVVRNKGYVKDLHGEPYELWVPRADVDRVDKIIRSTNPVVPAGH